MRELFYVGQQVLLGKSKPEITDAVTERLRRYIRDSFPSDSRDSSSSQNFDGFLSKHHITGIERIPEKGGLVVTPNHPTVLDGAIVAAIVEQRRKDFKIIAAHRIFSDDLLNEVPVLSDKFLFVNMNKPADMIATKKAAARHITNGGSIIIFPSGRHESLPHWYSRAPVEAAWNPFAAKLARMDNVQTVPMHIHAHMSRVTLNARLFASKAEKCLYGAEFLDLNERRGFMITIGEVIASEQLQAFRTPKMAAGYLRDVTLSLGKGPA